MFLTELKTLPDQLVAHLDPVRVQEYVRASGWLYQPNLSDLSAVYQRPESDLEQIQVPLSRHLRDFTPRMAEAVGYIAEWEKRPALEVLHDLLLPPADLLRFAEAGPAADRGNLPLDHGLALLAGARKALLAAACSVLRPDQAYHPRLNLADAEQFLRQCRLGQTELGGYVVTVACPLATAGAAEPGPPPFGRRVTALLMRSLARLARAVQLADVESAVRAAPDGPLLSANLCDSLLDMAPEGDDSSLTISARWAHLLPADDTLPGAVRLRREDFPGVETAAARLRPALEPKRRTFIGFVDTLDGRPKASGRRAGPVLLRLVDPESESIRARADLCADAYEIAYRAHNPDRPVRLRGLLRRVGRHYRIDEVSDFHFLETERPAEEAP